MRIIFALLLTCLTARSEDVEGARDNFDTIVRGHVAEKSVNDVWTLKQRGTGKDLKLRYAKSEPATVKSLGGGQWKGLADFTDASGKKRFYAEVVVSMRGDSWSVKTFKWKTGPEAAAIRAAKAAPATTAAAAPPGPLPALLAANAASNYDPSRDTKADIKAALAEAKRTNRRVLVEVGSKTCVWCDRMHRFVSEDDELKALKEKNFVTVLADMRANGPLWKDYGPIPGTPHLFVLGEDGGVIRSQDTEELEKGPSYDREKFMTFLNDWAPSGG
jgi:hypothetical protein